MTIVTATVIETLETSGESGPFVLTAHSSAVSTARILVKRRPDMIAGLVLLDPGPDVEALKVIGPVWAASFDASQAAAMTCIRATAEGEMRPGNAIYVECGSPPVDGPFADRAMAQAVLSENESPLPSVDQIASTPGSLGDLPLMVLTAENKFNEREGAATSETQPLRRAWADGGATLAALSRRGRQRIVSNASHIIQIERPDEVVMAVGIVLEQARAASSAQVEAP